GAQPQLLRRSGRVPDREDVWIDRLPLAYRRARFLEIGDQPRIMDWADMSVGEGPGIQPVKEAGRLDREQDGAHPPRCLEIAALMHVVDVMLVVHDQRDLPGWRRRGRAVRVRAAGV